jgi:hypothetical protein
MAGSPGRATIRRVRFELDESTEIPNVESHEYLRSTIGPASDSWYMVRGPTAVCSDSPVLLFLKGVLV